MARFLTYERKLYAGILLLLAGLTPLFLEARSSLVRISAEKEHVIEVPAQALALTETLRYLSEHEKVIALEYILTGKAPYLERIQQAHSEFLSVFARLKGVAPDPQSRELFARIAQAKLELERAAAPGFEMRRRGEPSSSVHAYMMRSAKPHGDVFHAALNQLFEHELAVLDRGKTESIRATDRTLRSLAVLFILVLVGLAVVALLLALLVREKKVYEGERERLYEEAKRVSQARKEVLEIVSHDLKNPLTIVELNAQLLASQPQTRVERIVQNTLSAVKTMTSLVQTLLEQAKLESGNIELHRESQSVSAVLGEVRELLGPLACQKSLQVDLDFKSDIPPAFFDRQRISQVVSNILGNAIKFTPPAGTIEVRVSSGEKDVTVSISDTGPGIPREELSRVFDPFWQASATRKLGTGLGLTIAKGIVDAHGGQIWAESRFGEGTTFRFSLPRAA